MYQSRYRWSERLLHCFAFRSAFPQVMLADLEEYVFSNTLDQVAVERPVFIAGLPRSGTTVLLNLLVASGQFASHTYRDMPFIMCPLLWKSLASRLTVDQSSRERAHGDGLQVSAESPEGFEEVFWKWFWPSHYEKDCITVWSDSDSNDTFDEFYLRHMAKIIALRNGTSKSRLRYISKNNTNIARLAAPPKSLRDGLFLVPYREPVQHAASLLRQHRRFCALQAEEPFILAYMNGVGHHEFGRGLRPINFGGWLADSGNPDELEFWLRYWIAAYAAILACPGSGIHLVSYDDLAANSAPLLVELARVVDIPAVALAPLATVLRRPRTHDVSAARIDRGLKERAEQVYLELHRRCVEQGK